MKAQELINKYNLDISPDGRLFSRTKLTEAAKSKIKEQKAEIIEIIKAEKEAQKAQAEKEHQEYMEKLNGIEGLKEIEALKEKWERYNYELDRSIYSGSGIIRATKPSETVEELEAKYPRAAAYRKACNWSNSRNYKKSSEGTKASERILNGEDYEQVIKEMEDNFSEYCTEHIWD